MCGHHFTTHTHTKIPGGFKPWFAAGPKLETCVTRLPGTSRHLCSESFSGWTRQDREVPLEWGADSTTSRNLSLLSWEVAHSRNGQATSWVTHYYCLDELNVSWKPPTSVLTPPSHQPCIAAIWWAPSSRWSGCRHKHNHKDSKMCAQTHGFFHAHQIITKNISTAVSFCCRGRQGKGSTWPKLLSQGYLP